MLLMQSKQRSAINKMKCTGNKTGITFNRRILYYDYMISIQMIFLLILINEEFSYYWLATANK